MIAYGLIALITLVVVAYNYYYVSNQRAFVILTITLVGLLPAGLFYFTADLMVRDNLVNDKGELTLKRGQMVDLSKLVKPLQEGKLVLNDPHLEAALNDAFENAFGVIPLEQLAVIYKDLEVVLPKDWLKTSYFYINYIRVMFALADNKVDEATLEVALRAYQLNPKNLNTNYMVGLFAYQLKDVDKAKAVWDSIVTTPNYSTQLTPFVKAMLVRSVWAMIMEKQVPTTYVKVLEPLALELGDDEAMIKGMVSNLENKLNESWKRKELNLTNQLAELQRLIRAYKTLGQADKVVAWVDRLKTLPNYNMIDFLV